MLLRPGAGGFRQEAAVASVAAAAAVVVVPVCRQTGRNSSCVGPAAVIGLGQPLLSPFVREFSSKCRCRVVGCLLAGCAAPPFLFAQVGFYSDPAKGWIEGVAILCAVLVVAVVTATNDYSKDEQFRALNAVKDDVNVQASPGI